MIDKKEEIKNTCTMCGCDDNHCLCDTEILTEKEKDAFKKEDWKERLKKIDVTYGWNGKDFADVCDFISSLLQEKDKEIIGMKGVAGDWQRMYQKRSNEIYELKKKLEVQRNNICDEIEKKFNCFTFTDDISLFKIKDVISKVRGEK